MKKVKIKNIRSVASLKKPGYLAACRAQGTASPDGQWLTFTDAAHAALAVQYATPQCPPCTKLKLKLPTLGQAVDRKPPANCKPCLAKAQAAASQPGPIPKA